MGVSMDGEGSIEILIPLQVSWHKAQKPGDLMEYFLS